ncbi:ABC transporter substrate-binding protein [Treponema phagedenis]|uniref:ABC transporter substrate-binding protein n=1 Tax=Treponema phagedenis TaxID=162 RepID=UPI0011E650E5|nr:ABC transporter substrate-binding protein [Treponema phagedenis]QEK00913.1 ABC transporter substrate-binding protein [Treponema phagedenis]QEK05921.1 ABC transporter substrate-binding protein [Treponema phagedenis]
MKAIKKISLILCLTVLALTGITACNRKTEKKSESKEVTQIEKKEEKTEKTKDENKKVRTITDHAGNKVEVPEKVERIVIDQIPILSTYMAYHHGKAPYIVGYAGSLKQVISNTVLKDIAPELLDSQNTVQGQSDINIEEIMKLKPDVIFYNASNKEHYETLKKTGIPCVGFATVGTNRPADPIDRYTQWLKLLEDVFGESGKTDDFVKAGQEIVRDVEERISKIDDSKKPTGVILWKYTQGLPMVAGKGVFGDFWLKRIAVKNLAGETKGFAKVSIEQFYQWNPDILYLDGPGLLDITTKDVFENSVEGINFSNMKAVKDKKVYNTKLGMWNWFTPNPDGPLVLAWLAKSTYPEEFKDYDLKAMIKDYYKTWYDYELTNEQIEDMFNI